MNVNPIHRASRQGTRTVPAEPSARSKRARSDTTLHPDEIELAVEMARHERIERDVAAYAIRKRAAE